MNRPTRRLSTFIALALGAATLSAVATTGGTATAASDSAATAVSRLRADATGAVRLVRDRSGRVTFVGTDAGEPVDNPAVSRSTSVAGAARAHLDRYGAALGATRPGTSLVQGRSVHTVAGTDAVSYDQEIGGLPVLGGGVVVTLDEDRELASALATLSRATKFPAAKVSAAKAARVARAAAVKAGVAGSFEVVDQGRWVLDPEVVGGSLPDGAIAVHRFEVTDGVALRRMVLVDDQAGRVVMNLDQIQHADRVVCDLNNAEVDTSNPPLCTSGFARTEGQAPVAVADVNDAYDLSGAVSDYYDAIGDLDLTQLLGIDVGGQPKLASTVRVCSDGDPCPYENAFWNGAQMYYGQDYASADDVVGHEMTHGVIDQYSQLLYWGQSGAMNESMADIMGEFVDQRRTGDDDSAWDLGEDLPIGAIRNLEDPTLGEDPDDIVNGSPDKMTSPFYWDDPNYFDNQGVHYNSGVGNKTAYLISQGGSFNGQTITGIDTGDATLTRSAKLWLLTIQSLTSGSDYANLADVLEQSCQTLVTAGDMTAPQCTEVHEVTLATELRTTPPALPQPADAPDTCPVGTTKSVLFDSETGANPTAKFTSSTGSASWIRDDYSFLGSNATSGLDSWFGINPDPDYGDVKINPLIAAEGVSIPAGQQTYLWFQGWYLFEYGASATSNFDGGAVEVDDLGDAAPAVDVANLPWVNGPTKVLNSSWGNPAGGRKAFARDSNGWVASRVDLSSFAGKNVKPRFTTYGDDDGSYLGWWLDDIRVYTCAEPVSNTAPVVNAGPDAAVTVGSAFTSSGSFTDDAPAGATATVDYGDGTGVQPLTLTGTSFNLSHTYTTAGAKTVTVSVTDAGSLSGSDTATVTVNAVTPPPVLTVTVGTVTIKGKTIVGKKLKAKVAGWAPSGLTYTYEWLRNGKVIKGATAKKYLLVAKDAGKKIKVRVTGSKSGYTSGVATSKKTGKIQDA